MSFMIEDDEPHETTVIVSWDRFVEAYWRAIDRNRTIFRSLDEARDN